MNDLNDESLFENITDDEIDEVFKDMCLDDCAVPAVPGVKEEKKCDCGADKVYGKNNSFHSSWCSINEKRL